MSKQKILVVDDSPTIIKVVELVLTKSGYEVYSAQDGHAGIQLAKQYHPDLILLDFVMPKMNGYQVCKNLTENEELKDIPVVLMSAKGEQIGERFVKVMGIVDYITKPFSPEAIKAVVAKYADKKVDEPEQQIAEKSPEELEQQIHDEQKSRNTALVKLKSVIARKISAALVSSGNLEGGSSDNEQIQSTIKNALDDSFLESCFVNLENENFFLSQSQKEICLIGKIINIPIDEVLPLLSSLNSNGILTISKSNKKIEIYFQNGKIALASFNGKPNKFLLGHYIVEKEYMEQDELDQFIENLDPHQILGLQLIKTGKLTAKELKSAMTKQTKDISYEMITWDAGVFSYKATEDLPAIAQEADLKLEVDNILMECFRKVDEWRLIEKEIDDFDLILLRNDDAVMKMGRHKLMKEEITILELVNGRNSVRDIIRKSRLGSFDVSKILYRLLSAKLIRKKISAVAL